MKNKILKFIIFLIGISLCSYPLVSSLIEQKYQKNAVATYTNHVKSVDKSGIQEELKKAEKYNSMLFQSQGKMIHSEESENMDSEAYQNILNTAKNGIMGSIEIPKINVCLPIYHGTSDEVLATGVGHMEGTSLPVGGINSRTVLTGHRGLPNSRLFTRLDEMEKGDLFFIKVLDQILAYKVKNIEVIHPDESEKLKIVSEKDLATLLTCTPYGINTHRLLVTGERVEYQETEFKKIEEKLMSVRELFFAVLPVFFSVYGIVGVFQSRRKEKVRRRVRRKKQMGFDTSNRCDFDDANKRKCRKS